jgi:hypothetical protein
MTKKEEKAFLKEVEATGRYSLYQNAKIYLNFYKILEVTTNPKEFDKIWEKVPASSKMFFLQNSMKYFLKERGRESDGEDEQRKSSTKYDEMVEMANKLA